jgi:chemotaxis protein methyltransferase CheR
MSQDNSLQISAEVLKEISNIMLQLTGVQFLDKQSGMVQSRLFKRMIELGIKDTGVYLKYLKDNFQTESKILVSLLTTHHTFFFREFFHFDFLLKEALEKVIKEVRAQKQNKIRIWSAACSQGQEVYSLALFLDYHLPKIAPDIGYEILGTDIDIDCIKIAKNGVYRFEQIKEIPTIYQGLHWQKGTGEISQFVKIKDEIKKHCQFVTSNLFDMNLLMGKSFHMIFCRNVFIYFNQTQVASVSRNMLQLLSPNGYLFLGLSESLNGTSLPIEQVGPSIYFKPGAKSSQSSDSSKIEEPADDNSKQGYYLESQKRKLRVVCVDDSPIIITLLKKILTTENGFEIVGTATNGVEAHEMVLKHIPDIVTLDIHMPQMTGVEYLKKFYHPAHPPVVMISSVSREEAEFGVQSLEWGAVDFIEKPALATLHEKAEEIRLKLRCAVDFRELADKEANLNLVKSFKTDFSDVNSSGLVRICVAGLGDLQKIKHMVAEFGSAFPPFVVLLHGAESFIPLLQEKMQPFGKKVYKISEQMVLKSNHVYLGSFEDFENVKKMMSVTTPCHLIVMGETPEIVVQPLCQTKNAYMLLEESLALQNKTMYQRLKKQADEVCPYTSMIYHSSRRMLSQVKKVGA